MPATKPKRKTLPKLRALRWYHDGRARYARVRGFVPPLDRMTCNHNALIFPNHGNGKISIGCQVGNVRDLKDRLHRPYSELRNMMRVYNIPLAAARDALRQCEEFIQRHRSK